MRYTEDKRDQACEATQYLPLWQIGGSVTLNHVGGGGSKGGKWEAEKNGWCERQEGQRRASTHRRKGTQSPAYHSPFQCCVSMLLCAERTGLFPCKQPNASDCACHCHSDSARLSLKGAHIGSLEAEFIICP